MFLNTAWLLHEKHDHMHIAHEIDVYCKSDIVNPHLVNAFTLTYRRVVDKHVYMAVLTDNLGPGLFYLVLVR